MIPGDMREDLKLPDAAALRVRLNKTRSWTVYGDSAKKHG